MDIELTFINQSGDTNNSSVVIFQKNAAAAEALPVAWTVIENCGKGWSHKFNYPIALYAGVEDSWGNVSDLHPAASGQKWKVVKDASGNQMALDSEPATGPGVVEIKNALPAGTVSAQVYKDGRLLAVNAGLGPQQSAVFEFHPVLYIGVVSQITEGQIMNSAVVSSIRSELSLLGITKANIIMTGGGPGPDATPFKFTLQPIS